MNTHQNNQIRIMLADDHPLIRYSLKLIINDVPEFILVGEAANGRELIDQSIILKPDIIITDVKMPVLDGIQATKQLTRELPGTGIIALSFLEEQTLVIDMLQAGAKGYLLKDIMIEEVIVAINTVYKGQTYFSKTISDNITNMVAKGNYTSYNNLKPEFSEKEIDIIKLICKEYSTKQIADQLLITKRAVDGLRDNILKKINAKNTAGLVVYAMKNKIC